MTPLAGGASSANCQLGEDATNGIVEKCDNRQVGDVPPIASLGKMPQTEMSTIFTFANCGMVFQPPSEGSA